jgi:hypothetical protein
MIYLIVTQVHRKMEDCSCQLLEEMRKSKWVLKLVDGGAR